SRPLLPADPDDRRL
ncbi:hypothetical protein EE612_028358, partial [Oryza sativa]